MTKPRLHEDAPKFVDLEWFRGTPESWSGPKFCAIVKSVLRCRDCGAKLGENCTFQGPHAAENAWMSEYGIHGSRNRAWKDLPELQRLMAIAAYDEEVR